MSVTVFISTVTGFSIHSAHGVIPAPGAMTVKSSISLVSSCYSMNNLIEPTKKAPSERWPLNWKLEVGAYLFSESSCLSLSAGVSSLAASLSALSLPASLLVTSSLLGSL